MMIIQDESIRTIKIIILNDEIIHLLINYIKTEKDIQFTEFDKFNFEFIKEGSPNIQQVELSVFALNI